MISPLGPFAVFGDFVILLALVTAVASPGLPAMAPPRLATIAFAWAWILSGVLLALHAPAWTLFVSGSMIVASTAVVGVTVHLIAPLGDVGGGGPGYGGEDGRGGPDEPPPVGPQGGGDCDPAWWSEFEREFGRYVARRERETALLTAPVARAARIIHRDAPAYQAVR